MVKSMSIIIPCFNEEAGIEKSLKSIFEYILRCHAGVNFDVIIVNDGSTDNTKSIVEDFSFCGHTATLLNFEYNKGRGAAMKAGLAASKMEYSMFLDSDLSYDVEHISSVIDHFNNNPRVDVIVLSPYMRGGVSQNIPFSRLLLSKAANWILSGFFSSNISTVTSMARAYRTSIIQNIALVENGKELHLEILKKLYLIGAVIDEIPAKLVWKNKKERAQRLNKKKVAASAKKHFLYGFLAKPTRVIRRISLFVFLVSLWELNNLFMSFIRFYEPTDNWLGRDLWVGLSKTFSSSPHTVVIAIVCLIISIQAFTYLSLFSVLNMQHEEQLQHLLKILSDKKD